MAMSRGCLSTDPEYQQWKRTRQKKQKNKTPEITRDQEIIRDPKTIKILDRVFDKVLHRYNRIQRYGYLNDYTIR